jgi:PadR family transcriptional regulator PadR
MSDAAKAEVLQGTLDLLILKTLETLGSQHGYAIAQRILQRLEQRGWIKSRIGVSDNNRRARFYSLTAKGRNQLTTATDDWRRASAIINRVLRATS